MHIRARPHLCACVCVFKPQPQRPPLPGGLRPEAAEVHHSNTAVHLGYQQQPSPYSEGVDVGTTSERAAERVRWGLTGKDECVFELPVLKAIEVDGSYIWIKTPPTNADYPPFPTTSTCFVRFTYNAGSPALRHNPPLPQSPPPSPRTSHPLRRPPLDPCARTLKHCAQVAEQYRSVAGSFTGQGRGGSTDDIPELGGVAGGRSEN